MKILNFLSQHLEGFHTPETWADLVGIEIIDADGWRTVADFHKPCGIHEFLRRINQCTIKPTEEETKPTEEASRKAWQERRRLERPGFNTY